MVVGGLLVLVSYGVWLDIAVSMAGASFCSGIGFVARLHRSPGAAVLVSGIIAAIAMNAHVDSFDPPVPLGPLHRACCQCPVSSVGTRRLVVFRCRCGLGLGCWCCWEGALLVTVGRC